MAKKSHSAPEPWRPVIDEVYEMCPRANDPPLRIPDVRIAGAYWTPGWTIRRHDSYTAGLFNDGDIQIRRAGETSGVMRAAPGGRILVITEPEPVSGADPANSEPDPIDGGES